MTFETEQIEQYLGRLTGDRTHVLSLQVLGDTPVQTEMKDSARLYAGADKSNPAPDKRPSVLKIAGYGQPVLVQYRTEESTDTKRVVLRTAMPNHFGHEYRADRAAEMLHAYDIYNALPNHVRAVDVGIIHADQRLTSLAAGSEFFLLTEYAAGQPYADDLQRLRDTGELTALDTRRARALAAYLADIHAVKQHDPPLYFRHVRDTIGSGEGIMGLCDNYPDDFALAGASWLAEVEKECIAWRWTLKQSAHRLSQLHGDFHPFNILFTDDVQFQLLDRSRSVWGEPGDDVACLAINYLFFSLQRSEMMDAPFGDLWDVFWDTYLHRTADEEILDVLAPFFVWRALVLASPLWYNVAAPVRETLLHFIVNILHTEHFDPAQINTYLRRALF